MKREKALPIIERRLTEGDFVSYVSFDTCMTFERAIVNRLLQHIPDWFDAMASLSAEVTRLVKAAPVKLFNAPTDPDEVMGQLELLFEKPIKTAYFVVLFEGRLCVSSKEWFPFP